MVLKHQLSLRKSNSSKFENSLDKSLIYYNSGVVERDSIFQPMLLFSSDGLSGNKDEWFV